MVELHDGTLDIESEPGVGTTVILNFPHYRVVKKTKKQAAEAKAIEKKV